MGSDFGFAYSVAITVILLLVTVVTVWEVMVTSGEDLTSPPSESFYTYKINNISLLWTKYKKEDTTVVTYPDNQDSIKVVTLLGNIAVVRL